MEPKPQWSTNRRRRWYRRWAKQQHRRAHIQHPRVEYEYAAGNTSQAARYWTDGTRHVITLDIEHQPTVVKKVLLHELGHAYEYLHENETRRREWLQLCELDSWATGPWGQRGTEHYAEHYAWGLMDQDLRLLGIGDPNVTVKRLRFRWITGKTALS